MNSLSPFERVLLEKVEENNFDGVDLNAVASTCLQQSERVQRATLVSAWK